MTKGPRIESENPTGVSITCTHYGPVPGSRRCRSYQDGGLCQRPGAAVGKCLEWLKVNSPGEAPPEPASRDLFGAPVPTPPPMRSPDKGAPSPAPSAPPPEPSPPLVRNVTDEQIASFKALGVEVCIRSEHLGDIYLVPEYTGEARAELSIEHSVTLTAICSAFPGAKVVEMKRKPA